MTLSNTVHTTGLTEELYWVTSFVDSFSAVQYLHSQQARGVLVGTMHAEGCTEHEHGSENQDAKETVIPLARSAKSYSKTIVVYWKRGKNIPAPRLRLVDLSRSRT